MKKISILSVLFVIISLMLCMSLGYTISLMFISATVNNTISISQNSIPLFVLYSEEGVEIDDIKAKQDKCMSEGYAGYIVTKDEKYYLALSAHKNQTDAELLRDTNTNTNFWILQYDTAPITIQGNFSSEEESILRKSVALTFDIYDALYDIALSIDTNIYTTTTAKLKVNDVIASFISTYSSFKTLFKNSNFGQIDTLAKKLENINNILSRLSDEQLESPTQTYSSFVKFCYCKLLFDQ